MKSRYLFRAKRINDAQWIEGYLIYSFTGVPFIVTEYDHILALVARDEVDPETICQCTGLRDDNGTPIFENDVLSLTDKVNDYEWKAVVKFGNPNAEYVWGWWLIPLTKCDANKDILLWIETELNTIECRVINNIFDNKKLLESEE